MDFFVLLKHDNKLEDFPGASFGFLDVLNTKQDGVAVGAIEKAKEFGGTRFGV